ncbi:MAG: hypothetical protein JNK26_05090 [Candidatus Doudnabacteria bacterium]|nr:hypothetical protein [Candidatus Doudnabacteria bacterium]
MALTTSDKKYIQNLLQTTISQNNDMFFARIVDLLKNFATKDDLYELREELISKCAKQEDLLELKDDVAQIRVDLDTLKVLTEKEQREVRQDIQLVKARLNLV